jgi:hypothetical protein
MQIYFNGKVSHFKQAFSNVSFPASGPTDEFLAECGAVKVSLFREHDRATQKLVSCEPVVENGFVYVVEVVDKTEEEIAADVASKAAQMRATRNKLLADTDWRFRSDMTPRQEWVDYCQALRDLPEADGWPDVDFPAIPGSTILSGNGD